MTSNGIIMLLASPKKRAALVARKESATDFRALAPAMILNQLRTFFVTTIAYQRQPLFRRASMAELFQIEICADFAVGPTLTNETESGASQP